MSHLLLIPAVCLVLAGCGPAGVIGVDGGFIPGSTSDAREYVPGLDTARATAQRAAQVACGRLYGDCKSQCSSIFATCGTTLQECVDNYVERELAATPIPWSSAQLGNLCAEQLRTEACSVLGGSVECEATVERGCPNDSGPGGYSWLVATDVGVLPKTLTMKHCGAPVAKWLKVELPAGVKLRVKSNFQESGHTVQIGRLREGERNPDTFDSLSFRPAFAKPSKTITIAGTYFLEVYLDGAHAPRDLQLELSTETP